MNFVVVQSFRWDSLFDVAHDSSLSTLSSCACARFLPALFRAALVRIVFVYFVLWNYYSKTFSFWFRSQEQCISNMIRALRCKYGLSKHCHYHMIRCVLAFGTENLLAYRTRKLKNERIANETAFECVCVWRVFIAIAVDRDFIFRSFSSLRTIGIYAFKKILLCVSESERKNAHTENQFSFSFLDFHKNRKRIKVASFSPKYSD